MIETLLPYAAAAGAGFLGLKLFAKGDSRVEQRRLDALKVSAVMDNMGLHTIATALQHYAVGDYSGMVGVLKAAAATMTNPESAKAEFEGVFRKMLIVKLTDPVKRKALMEEINVVGNLGAPAPDAVSADSA